MSWVDALLLGLVQGLTEFLPVSSSGHLVLMQTLLGVHVEGSGVGLFGALLCGLIIAGAAILVALGDKHPSRR